MQPGEMVVASLGKGARIVRAVGETASRVSVALDAKRQARIPHDRILLTTGLVVGAEEEAEGFREQCHALSSDVELSEVWEVVLDEPAPMGLESLAELHWGSAPDAAHLVAVLLHLEEGSDYFIRGEDGYTPRPRESVAEVQARRRREEENAKAEEALMRSLSEGELPGGMAPKERELLEHLRGYAVHGDDYTRSAVARRLLEGLAATTGDLQQRSFDLLVGAGVFTADEPLELHRAEISAHYPDEAITEAELIRLPEHLEDPRRRDLTDLPTLTIDDVETEERDDAVSVEVEEQGAGPDTSGGFRIRIHVADAEALIPQGGAIDREADRRMSALYLPERTIGMLPPGLTRRVGSLDAGERRVAVSLLAHVTSEGDVSDWEVTPSVVASRAALTYEEADAALTDESNRWHRPLKRLDRAALALRRKRARAGAINLEQPEMAVKVKPTGEVEVRVLQRSGTARSMVAELMILCNSLLAELCRREQLPAAYRSQAAPDLSDLPVEPGNDPRAGEGPLWRYLVTRRLRQAELDTIPAPHGSLGVPAYIQVTSPLRRYPDLVMQRQISHFLSAGGTLYSTESIASVAQRAEVQLRELARLEEGRKRYWFLKYLRQSRLEGAGAGVDSDLFSAVVLDNDLRRTGLLELVEFPFRVRAELSRACAPGDTVTLKLRDVDLWRRVGYFVQTDVGA